MTVIQLEEQHPLQDPIQDPTSKNHFEFISICLDRVIMSPTSEIKALHAKTLYDYLTHEAFTFVMGQLYFKSVVIKRAYRLKIICADFIELTNSINSFLAAIGEPLDEIEEIEEIEEIGDLGDLDELEEIDINFI